MPPPFPSIQSFYSSPSKPSSHAPATGSLSPSKLSSSPYPSSSYQAFANPPSSSSGTDPGDGFTAQEIDAVLHPPSAQWTPTQEYEEMDIGRLEPGPMFVMFLGRVVNFIDLPGKSKKEMAAKGCLKITVGDDTGSVTVRLWYANMQYNIRLGQLVTIWTVHVSHGEQAFLASAAAPLFTSIFPERERSCHIMLHENSDNGTMCKKPFGCKDTQALPGLMTLKNFHDGGYDVDDGKVLVCVKSIGARKKFTTKHGFASELISLGVFDDTAEAQLTLMGAVCGSASYWQPSYTVLLISNPNWKIERKTKLSLGPNTRVDIDPDMSDALWLRSLAQRLTKREHVNPAFPEGVFDTEAAETAAVRILYNLANIDDFARANPKERFMGYISVLITELHLVSNCKRNMLMSNECCGMPLYANAVSAKCRQCERQVPLRMNPRIIGPIIDETGQIASGKLIFSETAWEQLLGRTAAQFVKDDLETLTFMEHRLLFLRVSLGFGWCLEGSEPLPGGDDDGVEVDIKSYERKRKRLEVFRGKEEDKENVEPIFTESQKEMEEAAGLQATELKVLPNDGIAEVGRLCIWCVKM